MLVKKINLLKKNFQTYSSDIKNAVHLETGVWVKKLQNPLKKKSDARLTPLFQKNLYYRLSENKIKNNLNSFTKKTN